MNYDDDFDIDTFDNDYDIVTDKEGNDILINDNQDIDLLEYLDNLAKSTSKK